jgi:hypothetical protein
MVSKGVRICDVCGETIPRTQKYAVNLISRQKRGLFLSLNQVDPELKATFTEDADGTVRLEICLDCKMNMSTAASNALN